MKLRVISSLFLLTIVPGAGLLFAFSDLHNSDPSQWTGVEVHQILNNSAWAKTVKMNFYNTGPGIGNQSAGNGPNNSGPVGMGGTGRRGMGAGRSNGTYSSGGGSRPPADSKSPPEEVTIQWQSALVIRMAAAKRAGGTTDAAAFKPLDEYVIALIGLPMTAVGGRGASADSDSTLTQEDEQRIQERVKSSASILRSGYETLTPTKVELDQGKDGRMLIHFSKSAPINVNEKSVEFHLDLGRTQIRKKFPLNDMEYQGKLEI
jgi:hypothetical protein